MKKSSIFENLVMNFSIDTEELSDGIKYWCDNKYGYLEHARYTDGNGGSSAYKVAAWKPIEPYKRKEDK